MQPEITQTIEHAVTPDGLGFVENLPAGADDAEFGWQKPTSTDPRARCSVLNAG